MSSTRDDKIRLEYLRYRDYINSQVLIRREHCYKASRNVKYTLSHEQSGHSPHLNSRWHEP